MHTGCTKEFLLWENVILLYGGSWVKCKYWDEELSSADGEVNENAKHVGLQHCNHHSRNSDTAEEEEREEAEDEEERLS